MRAYGALPKDLGQFEVANKELFYYQYLPIKLISGTEITVEPRLHNQFGKIIGVACCDFVGHKGLDEFVNTNIYLTAKRLRQTPQRTITRPGWHSDGFLTEDTNYLWSDCQPTVFNTTEFNLSDDDTQSIVEMGEQAVDKNNVVYDNGTLLRLDPFVIHRNDESPYSGIRTFVKLSFSRDKYDLEGNSINYLLNYNWEMRPRQNHRNVPQEIK